MASARVSHAWILAGLVSFGVAAGPKAPPADAPDPDFLEYLVLNDEPGVPLPEPDKPQTPAGTGERARPTPPVVKKP